MSSIAEVEELLTLIRKSFAIPSRNTYEAENAYITNMERLKTAREKLKQFSGKYVEQLLNEICKLERELNDELVKRKKTVDTILEFNFTAEENNEEDEDEVAAVERELEKKREGKKKQGGKKVKNKKVPVKEENIITEEKKNETTIIQMQTLSPKKEIPEMEFIEIAKYTECNSSEILQEVIGQGQCVLISNTPLARLDFNKNIEYDGISCQCRVTLYRAVVTALTYGVPLTKLIDKEIEVNSTFVKQNNNNNNNNKEKEYNSALVTETEKQDDDDDDELENEETEIEASEESVTAELSKQLVAEYDAMLEEKEEEESNSKLIPLDIPIKLQTSLRYLTILPWIILMCHGGYFSGGIFINGKPVIHKSFQRYVVRKKQGGKQSSNDKENGSYGSIGSQIRRAQEIKWKIDVRDILLKWCNYIDAAAIILYVAPGPQNRSILTDFSSLPPITTANGEKFISPINLKDPRVRKAPLTTHRPSFQEVQRIFSTVSTCTIQYIRCIK